MSIFRTTQRILATLVILFAVSFAAVAQNVKLSLGNLVLTPGETSVVSLDIENDVSVDASVTADIYMPEIKGLKFTFVKDEKTGSYVERTSRVSDMAEVIATTKKEWIGDPAEFGANQMRVVIIDLDNPIEAGKGAILTFKVKVERDSDNPGAEIPLGAVAQIKDANVGTEYKFPEVNCPLSDGSFVGYLTASDFQITPSREVTVSVSMTNNIYVSMLQTLVTLPKGMSIVENDGAMFTPSNRVSVSHKIVTSKKGESTFLMIQPKSLFNPTNIVGNAGPIFTFKVRVDETFASEGVIRFSEVIGSSLSAKTLNFDDLTINVTNPDVEAIVVVDEAVKALNVKVTAALAAFDECSEEIQAALAEQKTALENKVAEITSAVTAAKNNGSVSAELETIQASIIDAEAKADALSKSAKDMTEEAAVKEAEASQYKANKAAIDVLRNNLAAAKAAAAEAGIAAEQAAEVEALGMKINDIVAMVEARHSAGTSVESKEEIDESVKAVADRITAINDAVAAANNATQNTADKAALAEVETAMSTANETIATYDESVQTLVAEAKAAAEQAIADASAAIAASFEAGTSVADKEANAALIAAASEAVTKLAADAKAAQDKFLADAAAAANEAQNTADKAALAEVETAMATANETIATYDESVQTLVAEAKAAAEQAIADASAAIAASFEAGTSVADKEANAALIAAASEAVTKLAADAKADRKSVV